MVICNNCGSPASLMMQTQCQVCGALLTSNINKAPLLPPTGNINKTPVVPSTPQAGAIPPTSYNMIHFGTTKSTRTSVTLSLILGLLGICGVGHFYINKIRRGVGCLIIGIILAAIAWNSMGIGFVVFIPFVVWTVYDAYSLTNYYNNHL